MLCLTTSIHLFLCLPLLRCPPTFASKIRLTQSSSSRRCICPYHLSLASRTLSVIHATPRMRRMSSFLLSKVDQFTSNQDHNDHRSILHISSETFHQWKCFALAIFVSNYLGGPHGAGPPDCAHCTYLLICFSTRDHVQNCTMQSLKTLINNTPEFIH